MSDYRIIKITQCPQYCEDGWTYTEQDRVRCTYCVDGIARIEVDLQEGLLALLKTESKLQTVIREMAERVSHV